LTRRRAASRFRPGPGPRIAHADRYDEVPALNEKKRPTLGLALSGGTAKSVAHVGVLEALTEAGIRPDYLAGTSGGAIVGAIYAAGFSVAELRDLAVNLRWKHLARLTFPKLGLLSNSQVERFITDLLGDITFADLKIPFSVVTTDLLTGNKVVFREGKVAQAVMLSTSIPNVFEPIQVGDTMYVDGGLVEYLPVETVLEYRPDVVVGVNLGYRETKSARPRHLLHVAMAVTGIAAQQNARLSETKADVVIRPPTARFPSFDLMASEELIGVGYRAAVERIPDIKAAMERTEPGWLDRLKFWSRES